jgi:transposase
MKRKRSFSKEFKRKVVEEWAGGQIGPAQLCRKYEISPGLLYHWKRQYSRGKYDNEPTSEGIMIDRIKELERMVGRLTMENDLLEKAIQLSMRKAQNSQSRRNGDLLRGYPEEVSGNGVGS